MQPTSWTGREATSRSNVYEINQRLWQFGRGNARLGGLSVAETEERRIAVAKDGAKRASRSLPGPSAARRRRKRRAADSRLRLFRPTRPRRWLPPAGPAAPGRRKKGSHRPFPALRRRSIRHPTPGQWCCRSGTAAHRATAGGVRPPRRRARPRGGPCRAPRRDWTPQITPVYSSGGPPGRHLLVQLRRPAQTNPAACAADRTAGAGLK